jgi:osmotically-inducible protein OsmY
MTQTRRPDIDIESDIHDLIAHYPPLQADRHHFGVSVSDGVVALTGHVKSLISRRYLVDRAAEVNGVRAVNGEGLFTEEEIRLEAGQHIPSGVIANLAYGAVILTGKLPDGAEAEAVVSQLAQIPGVEQVITKF